MNYDFKLGFSKQRFVTNPKKCIDEVEIGLKNMFPKTVFEKIDTNVGTNGDSIMIISVGTPKKIMKITNDEYSKAGYSSSGSSKAQRGADKTSEDKN